MAKSYVDNDHEEVTIPTERFLDLAYEPDKDLAPIKNYEKVPLVSLEEAVQPIEHLLDNVAGDIWIAKRNCKKPLDNLTVDESAAIYLYSMESLYRQLNAALRNKDRKRLIPWFPYLKLYLTALWKLPNERSVIWRGIKADISEQFGEGETFIWWGFSSCTTSLKQAEQFLGKTGQRTLFSIEPMHGKRIENHSHFPKEREVLLLPCSCFQVLGCINQSDGLHIIHIREIEPPVPLIQPPFDLSATNHQISSKPDKYASQQSTTSTSATAVINNASANLSKTDPLKISSKSGSTISTTHTLNPLTEKPRLRLSINAKPSKMGANDKYLVYCSDDGLCVIDQQGRQELNVKQDFWRVYDIYWSSFLQQFLILAPPSLYSLDITKRGQQLKSIKEFPTQIESCTCYEDIFLISVHEDESHIEEYNMSSNWKLIKTFKPPISCDKKDRIYAIKFNSDGSRLGVILKRYQEHNNPKRFWFELRNPYDSMKVLQIAQLTESCYGGLLPLANQQFLINSAKGQKFYLINSNGQLKQTIEYDGKACASTALINENCLVIQTDWDLLRFYDL